MPFAEGEKWRVVQGMSSSAGTHKSFAAFALDFHSAPYPGTCDEKILAVSAGKVVQVEDDDDDGGNFIIVELAPDVLVYYLHNFKGSSRVKKDDQVEVGDHIANIGVPKCHLHLSVRSRKEPVNGGEDAVTIPWAFESFCACTPATTTASTCTTWVHHKHDVPLNDQWISWA